MCGINGFNFKDLELIKKMSRITHSRGPDNEGFSLTDEFSVGHNRLAIIDPEERSNQPYKFDNLILSFNGEIYNFLEIKKKLISKGYNFKTTSDTEVIIKLFHLKGIESFKDLSGIFSISIYDTNNKKLYLIRDTVGVKPLYYYHNSTTKKFIFSSLIKPILISSNNIEVNEKAIDAYANFNRNDLRETFYKNIFKVLPGELIELHNGNIKRINFLKFNFNKNPSTENLTNDIKKYFNNQFLSDVPVALSLSGGVDSNVVLNELLKCKGTDFTNYSVSFKNSKKYQLDHSAAKNISKFYGLKFNSIEVSPQDFQDYAEKVVDIVEEPVGNSNSISNYVLSEKVEQKVLFSGDGGDEVFTGYDKYRSIYILTILKKFNFLSKKKSFKNKNLNRLLIDNSRDLFLTFSEQNLLKSQNKAYKNFKIITKEDLESLLNHTRLIDKKPKLNNVMYHDLDTWVPNDILNRNDKIYSNKGIEVRVPFLDKNIVENYLMLDNFQKFGPFFKSKNVLFKFYKKQIKFSIHKKLGFNSPFAGWLRNEIYDFAKNILSKDYYDSSEILNLNFCQQLLKKHKDQYYDPYLIWNLISLQIFLRKNKF
ncbi:asparagine synthase (glutamine-hydrolyzing) [Candidatus Pelagibacter sp.]|nr:asparagine synthase (glutamine-hydrolyzing) [Candidatus Pelagibacter sp.]